MRPWKDPEVLPRVCRANNGAGRIYELALRKTLGAQAKPQDLTGARETLKRLCRYRCEPSLTSPSSATRPRIAASQGAHSPQSLRAERSPPATQPTKDHAPAQEARRPQDRRQEA